MFSNAYEKTLTLFLLPGITQWFDAISSTPRSQEQITSLEERSSTSPEAKSEYPDNRRQIEEKLAHVREKLAHMHEEKNNLQHPISQPKKGTVQRSGL
jgi:hypothetical protein